MSRRSARLESTQYYDANGEPVISYRETLHRVFRRRRTRRHSRARNEDTVYRWQPCLSLLVKVAVCLVGMFMIFTIDFLDQAGASKAIENRLRDLQDELHMLKVQMKSLHPAVDMLPNFALETLGARVIFQHSSETYRMKKTPLLLFGIPVCRSLKSPNTIIQGHSLLPGRCWPFAGGQGHVLIGLSKPVIMSHVTLGHISKSVSPTGSISSAPKEFSVYGLENPNEDGTLLGTFLYDQDGDQLQTFKIPDHKQGVINYVKLQVESNWGHPDFTCLYSFRVHGKQTD